MDRGTDKEDVVRMCNGILLSHLKEGNNTICSKTGGPREWYTEWSSVRLRRRNSVWHPLYVESKKKLYKWSYLQNNNRLIKQSYNCQGKGLEGEIVREFGMGIYTLLYLKWIINKDLLYSTWNSAQCYMTAWVEGEFGGEWILVYVWLSPFTVLSPETITAVLIGYTPIQNKRFS